MQIVFRDMRKKRVTLALQGGGSHGAFTWGVLDRLLEDGRMGIEGISGASAGAMNAVVLAHGHTQGGKEGAREALTKFWESVSTRDPFNAMPVTRGAVELATRFESSPATSAGQFLSRFFSPYQLNPFNLNPLREILSSQVDFEQLQRRCNLKLFVAATQVNTGMPRLFGTRELTLDVLLASACVPALHHTVEIDGVAYWDGGLSANPPIRPLLYLCDASDMLVVLLHPRRRPEVPTTADDIWHRLNEISFSSALFSELQGIALAKREAKRSLFAIGRLEGKLRSLNMHLIDAQELMSQLSNLSKLNTRASFINALRDEGRSRTQTWLEENFRHVGARSSFTLDEHLYS
jgi:NTE family protein